MNAKLAQTLVENMLRQFAERVEKDEPIPGSEAVDFITDAVCQAREPAVDEMLIITSGILFKGWTLTPQGDGSYTLYDPVSRLELKNVKLIPKDPLPNPVNQPTDRQ